MGGGGVVVFDSQLWAKIPEGVVVKLFLVIKDQDSRDPILADDVPLNEASHILLYDGGQGFNFYPFGEIVYADYKELQLSYCYREWAHDIQFLLSERPWGRH